MIDSMDLRLRLAKDTPSEMMPMSIKVVNIAAIVVRLDNEVLRQP